MNFIFTVVNSLHRHARRMSRLLSDGRYTA